MALKQQHRNEKKKKTFGIDNKPEHARQAKMKNNKQKKK